MRILLLSSAVTYGGGERHFVDLCRELQSRGHEVFAVLRPTCQWEERLDFIPPENIRHVSIRNSFGVFSAKRIAAFMHKKEIDVLHAHLARDYFPASLACRIYKKPKFVLTRHVLFPMQAFYRFALSNLSAAVAVSPAVETELNKYFPGKVYTIPNGIPLKSWDADEAQRHREAFRFEHDIPYDVPLIGTVGELKELKGQEDLVLAAPSVLERFPDARFIIVGKDNSRDKAYRRKLKRLVKVFGIERNFVWLDWAEEIEELVNSLDVLVSPSHSESFGLTILEALALRCPVVATETEGAKELLSRGEFGVLCPVKEPAKLADAIFSSLTYKDTAQAMALAGQAFAKETYGLDRMIERIEALYSEVLSRKK